MIVFGGLRGIECAVDFDKQLDFNHNHAYKLFDHWINVCPNQGSKTIRTEVLFFNNILGSTINYHVNITKLYIYQRIYNLIKFTRFYTLPPFTSMTSHTHHEEIGISRLLIRKNYKYCLIIFIIKTS